MSDDPRGSGERLVHILKLIASGPHHFSLSELADRSGLPPSSVHRLLKILFNTGLVERGSGQTYRPGRELYALASQLVSRFDLARSAKPLLEQLVAEWHETAVLVVYNPASHRGTITLAVHTPHRLRYNVDLGMEVALPWGSLGRVMLAHLPPEELDVVLANERVGPLTGMPLPSRGEIVDALDVIRADGYASYFEPSYDLAGIACAVLGANDELLGCLGITLPSARFHLLQDGTITALRHAAARLSEQAAISYS
jgi:DNA-binding IclR family transcriptional regulator|uniref:IclR family transcriptional regulator n=1 Tax=Altererythrobacter segetis TaxID=1104773 RepID=UPI00140B4D17|nr:IclR family transcriptional regulator [Altererythrobacter segetis]